MLIDERDAAADDDLHFPPYRLHLPSGASRGGGQGSAELQAACPSGLTPIYSRRQSLRAGATRRV